MEQPGNPFVKGLMGACSARSPGTSISGFEMVFFHFYFAAFYEIPSGSKLTVWISGSSVDEIDHIDSAGHIDAHRGPELF